MFDKDKFKSSLTNHDIEKYQRIITQKELKENGEIIAETICHNKTGGSHKLYYYPETQLFHCYTGCGSFDVFTLIEKQLKMEGKLIHLLIVLQLQEKYLKLTLI